MSGATVLVVDDSASVRTVAAARLRAAGYAVTTAGNVAELATALSTLSPDVVLLDVMMPELLGYDLVAFVRERAGAQARVVFLSSLDEETLEQHVAASGADGFLRKVTGLVNLAERVEALRQRWR